MPEQRGESEQTFERLSSETRQVLTLAQEEAFRLGHYFIDKEHLLLGLLREGTVAEILSPFGVNENKIRSVIDFIMGSGDVALKGEIGLTPRAKSSIRNAVIECRSEGTKKITPLHLLRGIVKDEGGFAVGILDAFGVNPKTLDQEIRIGPVLNRLRTTLETMDQEARKNLIKSIDELIEGTESKS